MKTFYATDSGLVRDHNEDGVLINKNLDDDFLLIVADGMGGHSGGEIASSMAVDILGKAWAKHNSFTDKKEALKWLNSMFVDINQKIYDYANENVEYLGMGTTLTVALVFQNYTVLGHVGDSRCYVLTKKTIHQISKDHTLVNHLLKRGDISRDEAINHPKKNVLMKAVGTNKQIEVDYFDFKNDYNSLLICSDGLTDLVSDSVIYDTLVNHNTIDYRVDRLISQAKSNGGYDNISVALIEVGDSKQC